MNSKATIKSLLIFSLVSPGIILLPVHFWIFPLNNDALVAFYSQNFRASLFSGFLSLGGFLFSLKTFIVIKMKENVYDHATYKTSFENSKRLNPKLTLYGPLKRLSDLLFWTVFAALLTAFCQFSIGTIPHWPAMVVCMWLAVSTAVLFVLSLMQIKANLNYWFKYLEDDASK